MYVRLHVPTPAIVSASPGADRMLRYLWGIVKIMVPFWVPIILRGLIWGTQKGTIILTIPPLDNSKSELVLDNAAQLSLTALFTPASGLSSGVQKPARTCILLKRLICELHKIGPTLSEAAPRMSL